MLRKSIAVAAFFAFLTAVAFIARPDKMCEPPGSPGILISAPFDGQVFNTNGLTCYPQQIYGQATFVPAALGYNVSVYRVPDQFLIRVQGVPFDPAGRLIGGADIYVLPGTACVLNSAITQFAHIWEATNLSGISEDGVGWYVDPTFGQNVTKQLTQFSKEEKRVMLENGNYIVYDPPHSIWDWIRIGKIICLRLGITSEMISDFLTGKRTVEEVEQELVNQGKFAKAGQLAPWVRRMWPYGEKYIKEFNLAPEALVRFYESTQVSIDEAKSHPPEAWPNPFNLETTIKYKVAKEGRVKLQIFSTTGQLINTLIDDEHRVGEFSMKWDGTNDNGEIVSSGMYFVRVNTPSYVGTTPITLVK